MQTCKHHRGVAATGAAVTRHSVLRGSPLVCVRHRRLRTIVHAQSPHGDNKNVDWDSAWTRFQNDMRSNVSSNVRTTMRGRPTPFDPAAKMQRDMIRRQESFMLDIWSSKAFHGAGVAAAAIILLAFVCTGPATF
eukprot:jgi/Chrzof1/8073/UNPLg00118.t1